MGQTCGHTTPKRATQWLKTPHKNSLVCTYRGCLLCADKRDIACGHAHERSRAFICERKMGVYLVCSGDLLCACTQESPCVHDQNGYLVCAHPRDLLFAHTHERSLARMRAHMCTYSSKRVHPHKSSLARMRTGSHLRACTQVSCRVRALNIDLLCACRHESFEEDHS